MTDSTAHDQGHHDPIAVKTYVTIGMILLVGTAAAYLFAEQLTMGWAATIFLIFGIATFKVSLVALYFMHLKFEGKWKYVLCVPPLFLFLALVMALLPDVAGFGRYG